ncbi:MAG TPA: hypothetical protein VG276_26420 [Actinomycetes bacterium]|nr:hypothetical protein [Actinomycetes bacterium]
MEGLASLAGAHGWFLGVILYCCKRLLRAVRRLLGWAWRSVLELAAWLGFQGRRVLIFFFLVYLVGAANWMFGGWAAARLAAVFFVLAWSAPKRRAVRNMKALRRLDTTTSELGAKLGNAKVVMLDGGADMLKALLSDPETDAQRDLGELAAKAHAAVGDHIPTGKHRPVAQHYEGPPNPFRRLRRARARRSKDEG